MPARFDPQLPYEPMPVPQICRLRRGGEVVTLIGHYVTHDGRKLYPVIRRVEALTSMADLQPVESILTKKVPA